MRNLQVSWRACIFMLIACAALSDDENPIRVPRSPTQPCLACTVLNKAQCCQRHGKCCSNQGTTTQNEGHINVANQPRSSQNPTRVRPVGGNQNPTSNQQSRNIGRLAPGQVNIRRYLPVSRQLINRATCPATRSINAYLRQQQCQPCEVDGSCLGGLQCCPPPTLCCRRLDIQGFCPLTVIASRCCRTCSSNTNCRANEGCCPQPGTQGCCVTACTSPRQDCPGRIAPPINSDPLPTIPATDTDTIRLPANSPVPTTPARSDRTEVVVIQDGDGNDVEVVVTIHVDDQGRTVTLMDNGQGGIDTITEVVEVTETSVQTVTEVGAEITLILTEIDGVEYTATPVGDNYVVTMTTVINNIQQIYVTTLVGGHHDVTVTEEMPPVTITENALMETQGYLVPKHAAEEYGIAGSFNDVHFASEYMNFKETAAL